MTPVVTFDLFSALLDSRSGAAAVLHEVAGARGWPLAGAWVYDLWDARNKELQRRCRHWRPYLELAGTALAEVYAERALDGDPEADLDGLMASLPRWPLWPDVPEALDALRGPYRVGVLSNVDDALFALTQASSLVEQDVVFTSERLRAYKPDVRIYHRAQAAAGAMVHVASSARDVRGSVEAGIQVVRLRRRGHQLDPASPQPEHEVDSARELPGVLAEVLRAG